jgi:nucleotide-binding universal stress UspA family protein
MTVEDRADHEEADAISRDTTRADMDREQPAPAIQRLLFIADSAVAEADELPPSVRAIIDTAAELYVVPPTLPGRLAWLADDIDGFRQMADERLEAVLGHMRSIGATVSGTRRRGSMLTVIADAVAEFEPDHILIALRSSEHANWQERKLIAHIEERFGLPLTTYAVDLTGHTSSADGPLILCYDGSSDARHAIQRAGGLFTGRRALVLTVWQPTAVSGSLGFAWQTAGMLDLVELDRAAAEDGGRLADEGVRIAQEANLLAEPVAIAATGPVWKTIVEIADRDDAATIVMGSRGLTGQRAMLLGSVSSAVAHHADRPTLIVPQPVAHA